MQFFKILPDLLKKINDRIKPELDKITNFDSVIKKHMCTNCHAEKAEEELKFMGRKWKCECGASSYMPVIEDKARKSRLEKLQLLTTIITGLKNELDKLETELDNKNKHKQRANEDKKISELERLLLVIRKKTNPKKAQPLKIEKNYKNLQMA